MGLFLFRRAVQKKGQLKNNRVEIELLYFEGCPTYMTTLKDLEALVKEEGIDSHMTLVKVESKKEAETLRFLGSPTVRVNGVDVEQPARTTNEYGLSCRIYRVAGKMLGSPPKEMLRQAIKVARAER